MKYQELIDKMTLEEKVGLCSGKDFWHLKSLERLGIPEIMITDGPHGLRKQDPNGKKSGLANSVPSTCFPTAVTTACSWDPQLLYEMGECLGEECLEQKVSVILGPGTNIKRSPLCGRNFEYFSEDPLLAGKLAAGLINGVQSKNVGTSLKHFAANSQETRRMTISSVVDERALREIYLTAFEIAVKESQPWTVMNAYNRINGVYCSDSDRLQNKILRDEWGFEGLVVSDWGAVNDRVKGIAAGNDLEMPSSAGINDELVCEAVRSGKLDVAAVDKAVDRVLDMIFKSEKALCDVTYDKDEHHEKARKIAGQSMVLLKNADNILPLKGGQKVAVIGELARSPRYQGAGSSLINPHTLSDAYSELLKQGVDAVYSPGYDKKKDVIDQTLLSDACTVAKQADVVLLFIGLTDEYESEGYDRTHLGLPKSHLRLAEEICQFNENVVVVLSGGSPVEMPFIANVKAVLNSYLGGQAGGAAVADIITGAVNPCGKLAETYPLKLEDTPCSDSFPGYQATVEYRESVYVGYRYYDSAKMPVLFPFGFGLSYTSFEYSDLKLSESSISENGQVTVSFKIKNTGERDGAEIAQLYVSDCESTIYRPVKELRGFKKVFLKAGEEQTVELTLSKRAFAFYNVNTNDWCVESGEFDVLVGASSRDIRLEGRLTVTAEAEAKIPDYRDSAPELYTADVKALSDEAFEAVLGFELLQREHDPSAKLTVENNLGDAKGTKWGGRINGLIDKVMNMAFKDDPNGNMIKAMALEIPIKNFITMSGGVFTPKMAQGLLMILNGEGALKGLGKILGGLVFSLKKLPELMRSI